MVFGIKTVGLLLIVIGVGLIGGIYSWLIFSTDHRVGDEVEHQARVGQSRIRLYIADIPADRRAGLSEWPKLAKGEGMLFVFEEPGYPRFWMKDMNFPIDMIWLDEAGQVVGVTDNISPQTYPATFSPPAPSLYVLEVPAGWSRQAGVEAGDRLQPLP